jgi:hypothetical protein
MQYPILEALPNKKFRLYRDYEIAGYKIPAGFVTDGLTLKSRFLRVLVDKYQPKFAPFFVLHDYLCDLKRDKEADIIGEKVLFEIEHSLRTRLMISFIKLYHKIKHMGQKDTY